MKQGMTMDELCEAEERREARQLSVDDWIERARVAEGEAVEYQNKYYAEKQKCQNTHERALGYLKEQGLSQIKFRRAEADKAKLVKALKHLHRAILVEFGGLQPHSNNVRKYIAEADAVLKGAP